MKLYIILDKDNMPFGDHYEGIGPIDITKVYGKSEGTFGLYLYDTVVDKRLAYSPDEHRVFEAEFRSCTLNGGNGRWCDGVRFTREVPKEECLAMKPAHYIELPEGMKFEDIVWKEEPGMVLYNPKAIARLTTNLMQADQTRSNND